MGHRNEEHRNEGCVDHGELGFAHQYSERDCPKCGAVFCWNCCQATNVHEGGKYTPDFMTCPVCGHDWYADDED